MDYDKTGGDILMGDKKAFHRSLSAFPIVFGIEAGIAGIAGIAGSLNFGIRAGLTAAVITFIVTFAGNVLYEVFASGKLKAAWKEWETGGFRGLWVSENIAKELKRNFDQAQTVKIKVTRGTELFDAKNEGEICTYLEEMRDRASKDNVIRCKMLLIAPCYKLKHVRERHKDAHEDYPTPEAYMLSWSETLQNIKSICDGDKRNSNFHINVRFYSGRHSKWRFYIFESIDKCIKTVLFADYDAERGSHGRKLPMYKVIENDQNIGGFMERYFDEIWDSALDREGLKKLILERNCEKRFCEECDIQQADSKECQLCSCPEGSCPYWKHCTEFANKYLQGKVSGEGE